MKNRANRTVLVMLAVWWLLNLIMGATVELADDEAYYWAWNSIASETGAPLAWGYFDHPPMVALLVWISSFLPGTLGVRFFSLLLQPLYLYLFWTLIRPKQPSRRDAWSYILVCFSMPLLQLYGLLALPDAPLLCFTVVFLWAFKRLVEHDRWGDMLFVALAAALLCYSKYHGVLVIGFVILSHPKSLKNPKLYSALAIALMLYIPHLKWQWEHDFPSFRYHLIDRNASFEWENIGDFLLSLLVVFNPLFLYHFLWKGWKKETCSENEATGFSIRRALGTLAIGFVVFFLFSAIKKYVQAQWVLPVVFAAIWAVWNILRRQSGKKYLVIAAWSTVGVFLVARLLVMTNPFGWQGEIWNNKQSYGQIASLAEGRPVLFSGGYAQASKYAYYTHEPTYCQSVFYMRESQWNLSGNDSLLRNRDIMVQVEENLLADTLLLANGKEFKYLFADHFLPTRKVRVELVDDTLYAHAGDTLHLSLVVDNPYEYTLGEDTAQLRISMFFHVTQRIQPERHAAVTIPIEAKKSTPVVADFVIPKELEQGATYRCGFCFGHNLFRQPTASRPHFITINTTQPTHND